MVDYASDCLFEIGNHLKGKHVFIACDKGNKKKVGHFIKFLCWWDESQQCSRTQLLDIDASEGDSKGCANAIQFSLKKLSWAIEQIAGQITDSGGGGVLESLAKHLENLGLCTEFYQVAACSLHGIQLVLSNPVKIVFGEGGFNKINTM